MKTTKIETPNNKHKKYYKELPYHIQFFNETLKITENDGIIYNFDEEDYNVITCGNDLMKEDKVMIPCDSSNIKASDWYVGKYENSGQYLAWLKLKGKKVKFLAIGYQPNCPIGLGFRFLYNIPNEQPEYKIIDREDAEKLKYLPHENNTKN